MGASVYWAPTKGGKCVGDGITRSTLEKAFDTSFPLVLGTEHLQVLTTLARLEQDERRRKNWQALIDAICSHESISVWAEY